MIYVYITGVNKTETRRLFNELVLNNMINITNLLCPVCKIHNYSSVASLENHLTKDHTTPYDLKKKHRMNYTCPICSRVLVRNSKYGLHVLHNHNPSLRHRWKCKLCVNSTAVINTTMQKLEHVQKEHSMFLNKCLHCFPSPRKAPKEYQQCSYCDKCLISTYMYRHCILHHLEEIPFCDLCSRYFINENSYALHMRNVSSVQSAQGSYIRPCKVYGHKNKIIEVNCFSILLKYEVFILYEHASN